MTPVKSTAIHAAPSFRTLLLTGITMSFFAGNSLLARRALRAGEIDAGDFTVIRIISGAAVLALLLMVRREGIRDAWRHGSPRASFVLFVYALVFSFAYLSMSAGTGSLVMFATVQLTMLGAGIVKGEHPPPLEWIGLVLAIGGLVYLVFPGLTAPPLGGVVLMILSGAAWGTYSLFGRGRGAPTATTAGNFMRAVPFAVVALIALWATGKPHASWNGIVLAAVSGAVTSGLGYVIWYRALRDLRTSLAAIVQLTVPVFAGVGGVVLLGEQLTWRLAIASLAILGGVALALVAKIVKAS